MRAIERQRCYKGRYKPVYLLSCIKERKRELWEISTNFKFTQIYCEFFWQTGRKKPWNLKDSKKLMSSTTTCTSQANGGLSVFTQSILWSARMRIYFRIYFYCLRFHVNRGFRYNQNCVFMVCIIIHKIVFGNSLC